jgi:hypothetical protein
MKYAGMCIVNNEKAGGQRPPNYFKALSRPFKTS